MRAVLFRKMFHGRNKNKEASIQMDTQHLEELPGVDVIMDWTRKYPYEKTLYSIFGGVTTPEQGLIKDREDFYLTRGYARNDRVGKSYLEYQYEEYLNPSSARFPSGKTVCSFWRGKTRSTDICLRSCALRRT